MFRSLLALVILPGAASAQAFVAGLGGAAALSNAAAATAQPVGASNYDSKVGPAFNLEAGYHLDDWFSVQVGYIWNRNRIVSTEVAGALYREAQATRGQHAIASDLLLYLRPRKSWVRPYLSAGPAWVRILSQDKLGLRVAVGAELRIGSGWSFRYSFSEVISANPLAVALHPPGRDRLMNFQNLFGVVKSFSLCCSRSERLRLTSSRPSVAETKRGCGDLRSAQVAETGPHRPEVAAIHFRDAQTPAIGGFVGTLPNRTFGHNA